MDYLPRIITTRNRPKISESLNLGLSNTRNHSKSFDDGLTKNKLCISKKFIIIVARQLFLITFLRQKDLVCIKDNSPESVCETEVYFGNKNFNLKLQLHKL